MWGLVLSALTIGVSMVVGNKDENEQNARRGNNRTGWERTSSTAMTPYRQIIALPLALSQLWSNTEHRRLFLAGAVFGIGCSVFYASLASYTRLPQRLRLAWNSMWNTATTTSAKDNDETNKKIPSLRFHAPLSIPSLATALDDSCSYIQNNQDGSIQVLVSPDHFATSSLTITLIRIPPGRELPSARAPGVEFYHVLSAAIPNGNTLYNNDYNDNNSKMALAQFSQQGVAETANIVTNDVFTVDAGHMRWISNARQQQQDLVLLRVTDTVPNWNERIRMDPNYFHNTSNYNTTVRFQNTMEKIRESIRQLVNSTTSTTAT